MGVRQGRIALVTGGARGIGRAIALRYARRRDLAGIAVFLAGPDPDYITGQSYHVDVGLVML